MLLGVDYYPEQWEKLMADGDLNRICQLGCNVIRIGEFAWHRMEPTEGKYDFGYFDDIIAKAKARGIKVIFGTPTATPPAWLIRKYPEILQENKDGSKRVFGGRHTFCFSSDIYIDYCKKIVTKLAEHYKNETNIIAWQIDNELGHEGSDVCWCDKCKNKFDAYLADKFYGDINKLNDTYGTAFWSQEYNSFEEIPLPAVTVTTHNPSLRLDFERFCSKNIEDFLSIQAEIIRSIIPDAVILHDFPGGGLDKSADYSEVAKHIDKAAYNNYPVWGGQMTPIPPHEIAFGLDYVRGLKGQNFLITEAIMGAQGHNYTGYLPRPRQAQMWSWQGVARGADGLMYFRYREGTKGAEQFCYGLIDSSNIPKRKFYEAKEFFEKAKLYADVLESPIKSDVAFVYSFDSSASMRLQPQSVLFDYQNEMKKLYKPFYDKNVMTDIIPVTRDFGGYKIIVVSSLTVCDMTIVKKIEDFVANGGIAVITYRTAVKDKNNNLTLGKLIPVDMQELVGGYVEECECVDTSDGFVCIGAGEKKGKSGRAGVFRDMLVATTAETLYRYGDEFYCGYSAVIKNNFGKGHVYYIGTSLEEDLMSDIADDALEIAGVEKTESPDGVEVVRRGGDKLGVRFIINHNPFEVKYKGLTLKPFECLTEKYNF